MSMPANFLFRKGGTFYCQEHRKEFDTNYSKEPVKTKPFYVSLLPPTRLCCKGSHGEQAINAARKARRKKMTSLQPLITLAHDDPTLHVFPSRPPSHQHVSI
jgi:hypothetical protein